MTTHMSPQELTGIKLFSRTGEKIGAVGQVYIGEVSGEPEWVTVRTGLFGSRESFVPLAEAELREGHLVVPYDKEKVKAAPNIGAGEHVDAEQESIIYRHYGVAEPAYAGAPGQAEEAGDAGGGTTGKAGGQDTSRRAGQGAAGGPSAAETDLEEQLAQEQAASGRSDAAAETDQMAAQQDRSEAEAEESTYTGSYGTASTAAYGGYETYGAGTNESEANRPGRHARHAGTSRDEGLGTDIGRPGQETAMTRSEEELRIGIERREAGRVHLHKYIVTEPTHQAVDLRHEEVRVVHEPVTPGSEAGMSRPEISEADEEVVLYEDRAVVDKQTVPKERVRLAKETTTQHQIVDEELRKERIDVEDDLTGERRSEQGGRQPGY